jgi:hypothetical protein
MKIFMAHGTKEGLLVNARNNEMWIFNQRKKPVRVHQLNTIIFDYWPNFELDCAKISKRRKRFH